MKQTMIIGLLWSSLISAATTSNLHRYMWANYKQFSGKADEARGWYNRIFDSEHHSIFTNKGYLYFLRDHGNYERIVELQPKLAETFKNDPDIQLIFVTALKKLGKKEEADAILIHLSHEFKTHADVVFQASEALVQRKEVNNALSLIDDYLNSAPRRPNNFIFYFLKSQMYMQTKDIEKARENITLCLEAHPRFPQGWLLLAMLEEQQGKIDSAIKGYTSYLELVGSNKQIEQHILSLALQQKKMNTNRPILFVQEPSFTKALMLFEHKQYQGALDYANQCLTQDPNNMQARLLKIQILATLNKQDELIAVLCSWIATDPENALWYQTLHLLSRNHIPTVRVITALSAIHTQNPRQLLPLLYLADLHTRAGSIDQAIHFHTRAKEIVTDPQLKTRLLYQLALLHYDQRQYRAMLGFLDELDATKQVYAPALNLRAYYYATDGNNVAEAQKYFEKAYVLDRGNPHFLDTQALIFYKQQEYGKALHLLQPIARKLPYDSTILIHLAKTYHQLGQYNNAQKTIDQAQVHAKTDYEKTAAARLAYQWKKA